MECDLEAAWQLALKLHGCVECARVDFIQRLRFMAMNKNNEIMGPVTLPLDEKQEPPHGEGRDQPHMRALSDAIAARRGLLQARHG